MLESNLSRFMLPSDLKLLSIKKFKEGYLWELQKARSPFEVCPKCGLKATIRAGKRTCVVKDEPIRGKSLWLKIHKHRYLCKSCKKTFTEPVSLVWPKRRTTNRMRKSVAKACQVYSCLDRVKKDFGVSSGFIYKIYYEQLEIKLRESNNKVWPEVVGLDEHFFQRVKGVTDFVTMITDLKKRKIFELAHGKNVNSLQEQLSSIPGRENVKLVVMDMSSTYKSFAKKMFPNARIIADKFHCLRLLHPAIMKAGKQIHGHRQELKIRRKLLMNRMRLDYFVRADIDHYLQTYPELNELYRWKEKLFEFYRINGFERAIKAFRKLLDQMLLSKNEAVQKLYRCLKRWRNEVLHYFDTGYTNAFTETMNRLGKLVQRRACGYKSFRNYRLRVLSMRNF